MNYAIILSGGIGSRMNNIDIPKQYIKVNGKPIIIYTLEKFENSDEIDKIIIVAANDWKIYIEDICKTYGISKLSDVVINGETRQESIYNGLKKCVEDSNSVDDKVIIHDAVRPMVTAKLIEECLKNVGEYDGCMPVLPLSDTIYYSDNGEEITNLMDRSKLYAGQAPEAFDLYKYYVINKNTSKEELNKIKGTSELAYKKGLNVKLIAGEDTNFKITTRVDLTRFEMIVKENNI
mgnify:CR=1 FL=1